MKSWRVKVAVEQCPDVDAINALLAKIGEGRTEIKHVDVKNASWWCGEGQECFGYRVVVTYEEGV